MEVKFLLVSCTFEYATIATTHINCLSAVFCKRLIVTLIHRLVFATDIPYLLSSLSRVYLFVVFYVVCADSTVTDITSTRPQRRCTANSRASLDVPIALPAKTRQRKPATTVEDIYLNRLWRSQMPKEKALESILESPASEQSIGKPTKRVRCLKFDDGPNRTKLRQRRQKAVKNGWKPLTKKQNALLDSQLAWKLDEINSDFLQENINNRNYSCLPAEKDTLQEPNANIPMRASCITSAVSECVANVGDHATKLSAGFVHDSCTHQVRTDTCTDADISATVIQSEKNVLLTDKSRNTSNDIFCEKGCEVKVELLKSMANLCQDGCDSTQTNTDNTVVYGVSSAISPTTAECLPSCVEENILPYQQQKKVSMNEHKLSKAKCIKTGMSLILEQQNEKLDYIEPGGLLAVEEHERSVETTAVQLQGIDKATIIADLTYLFLCILILLLVYILLSCGVLPSVL